MKNLNKYRLRTCIIMDLREYSNLIHKLTNDKVHVIADCYENQIDYKITSKDINSLTFSVNDILSDYFDVEVTSVHIDGFDYPYVWIVYKSKRK